MNHADLIFAHFAASGFELAADGSLPDEIQWAPPGQHEISAMRDGKPWTGTVVVNETGAAAVQRQFSQIAASSPLKPWFDFDHEGRSASGHPTGFRWAGNDPKTGGIRAAVAWSAAGKSAIIGREYQAFSPVLTIGKNNEITGSDRNMGGLVNTPAFRKIAPVWAKETDTNMSETNPALQATIDRLTTENADLKAKLAGADNKSVIQAKDTEIQTLKGRITELEGDLDTQRKIYAKAVVEGHVLAGRLPAANTAIQAKWIDAITKDPSQEELLKAMEVNPAFRQVTQPTPGALPGAGTTGEHEFLVKAKGVAASEKVSDAEAISRLAGREPDLYRLYSASLIRR